MKPSKDFIGKLSLGLGAVLLASGIYHLGYHHGLEFMRKSDSGLGGFAELATAWIQIIAGLILAGVGVVITAR